MKIVVMRLLQIIWLALCQSTWAYIPLKCCRINSSSNPSTPHSAKLFRVSASSSESELEAYEAIRAISDPPPQTKPASEIPTPPKPSPPPTPPSPPQSSPYMIPELQPHYTGPPLLRPSRLRLLPTLLLRVFAIVTFKILIDGIVKPIVWIGRKIRDVGRGLWESLQY